MARTMAMIVLTPFFGGKLAPNTVKVGFGVLLTVLVWPFARRAVGDDIPVGPIMFLGLMLKEIFIGFAIGFVNAHIFYAMEMAGRIIDTVRGSSMAEVQDPHSKTRATPFGDLYSQLMLIIFVMVGGIAIFMEAWFMAFAELPINEGLPMGANMFELVDFMMEVTAEIITIAAILAAPIVAATLISDIVFGILNRVAPQLNAYFMSMPVKAMGGVIMAFIILEPFVVRLESFVLWTLEAVEDTLRLLQG